MTAIEYIRKQNENTLITFIIAEAHKDKNTPAYHYQYHNTPIWAQYEWERNWAERGAEYLVVNADHMPIDITGTWGRMYERGDLKCAIIVHPDEMKKMYHPNGKQYSEMVAYYNRTVK